MKVVEGNRIGKRYLGHKESLKVEDARHTMCPSIRSTRLQEQVERFIARRPRITKYGMIIDTEKFQINGATRVWEDSFQM